jgi:tRNA-dihydrouridine synthase B
VAVELTSYAWYNRRMMDTVIRQNPLGQLGYGSSPLFHVREIPVFGDLVLSPMDGYSDLPFRSLCRELGSAMSYTEFVNVESLGWHGDRGEIAWMKLKFEPTERPVVYQIYGHNEDRIVETARRLQDRGPDIIDINMGCYVKKVAERGAGSGLLREPAKVARLISRLSHLLRIPVTAKIRLGWDEDSKNYMEIAKILEDNGASLIAVHARTKEQGFTGSANWAAIGEIKQAVKIPVIGNGDVKTVADIARIKAQTGCDAVMIGRAAIGNPWIFAHKERDQVSPSEKIALMRRHLALNLAFYGQHWGLVLFRKHACRYISSTHGAAALRNTLMTCNELGEVERLLESYAQAYQSRGARGSEHPHSLEV